MKKVVILFCVNLILVVLQLSFILELLGSALNPNLVLAYSFSLVFLSRKEETILSAFIGGLLLNIIGPGIPGLSSIILITFAYGIFFVQKYAQGNWFINVGAVFAASILYTVIFDFVVRTQIDYRIVISSMLTVVCSLVFYFVNRRLEEVLGLPKNSPGAKI